MEYRFADDQASAIRLLLNSQGRARIIAGGTDLVLDLESKKVQADVLIDVTRISSFQGIFYDTASNTVRIGSCVTHGEAAAHPDLLSLAPALAEGCGAVGSTQIRNVATIGGNIVSAQPAADAAVPLAALEAVCSIAGQDGDEIVPIGQMYAGFGKSRLDSARQILTSVSFQADRPQESCAYVRLARRGSLALPVLCVAARVRLTRDRRIERAVIAMAPVGVGPVRARQAEELLVGEPFTEETLRRAGSCAVLEASPRTSAVRGSREYRLQTLPVLVERALDLAGERALGKMGVLR